MLYETWEGIISNFGGHGRGPKAYAYGRCETRVDTIGVILVILRKLDSAIPLQVY
jgi:hypothetical protein